MENTLDSNKTFEPELDRQIAASPKDIPGWGVDADPENDPTYPMKHRTGADYERLNYERPPQQPVTVEVLHSIERPSVSAVFGTVTPPHGLSGAIRRYAFTHSESTYMHWVPLVLADRINVVEGIIDDIRHGHFPNIFAEKGWGAEWKYNRKGLIQKVAITAALTAGVIYLLRNKKK
jgi:hypothetical protein